MTVLDRLNEQIPDWVRWVFMATVLAALVLGMIVLQLIF
jgi:hypothetical protein